LNKGLKAVQGNNRSVERNFCPTCPTRPTCPTCPTKQRRRKTPFNSAAKTTAKLCNTLPPPAVPPYCGIKKPSLLFSRTVFYDFTAI